tara:strand:+ start:13544 stop:15094 length:1551 start_codon:yes stop_codon:yes gene_type:complete
MPVININNLEFKTTEKKRAARDVDVRDINNSSPASEVYESRASYKKQVNQKNLPLKNKNKNDVSLRNQLDLWYKDLFYGKKDYANRLITVNFNDDNFKEIAGTKIQALNFVADAVENFLVDYNVKRRTHPKSILNNIKIIRGYSSSRDYQVYFRELYSLFFADVLNDIKFTDKIKNIDDFINLFFLWSLTTNNPITETGFFKSQEYNIYNTGFAVDFITINSEKDKQKILNDPRYGALNYTAKMNGLKIDPNYPGRLIADVESSVLLEKYVSNYFPVPELQDLPELIYKNYFIRRNFYTSSESLISDFIGNIIKIYNSFIKKYQYRSEFSTNGDLSQKFARKFSTNRIEREKGDLSQFFIEDAAGKEVIAKKALVTYAKFRAKEEGCLLEKEELSVLTNNMNSLAKLDSSTAYVENSKFNQEKFLLQSQSINYLENFLFSKNNMDKTNTRDFIYFWTRGREYTDKFTTFSEQEALFSYLLAALDAKRIKCDGVHQMESGLFMPCKSHQKYEALTKK